MVSSETDIIKAAGLIVNAKHLVAFTGAGISVESGIPPFRGEGGIWTQYDPSILDIEFFCSNPAESWKGMLKAVITQNIDNMHFEAGNREVIEYHGNSKWLKCNHCGKKYDVANVSMEPLPPRCSDDQEVLKPAGMLPSIAKSNGAVVIEINPQRSTFTNSLTDIFLQGPAAEISKQLESYLF